MPVVKRRILYLVAYQTAGVVGEQAMGHLPAPGLVDGDDKRGPCHPPVRRCWGHAGRFNGRVQHRQDQSHGLQGFVSPQLGPGINIPGGFGIFRNFQAAIVFRREAAASVIGKATGPARRPHQAEMFRIGLADGPAPLEAGPYAGCGNEKQVDGMGHLGLDFQNP